MTPCYQAAAMRCRCRWDCSHQWCGCPMNHPLACICGVRERDCPIHGPGE